MIRPIFSAAFLCLVIFFTVKAQTAFGPPNVIRVDTIITNLLPYPVTVDVDRDNDFDVVIVDRHADDPSTEILYIFFNDGTGSFAAREAARIEYPSGASAYPGGLAPGDVDMDGDPDLLFWAIEQQFGRTALVLLENDGDGNFAVTQQSFAEDIYERVDLLDFDFDGDADLLLMDEGLDFIYWMRNDGNGTFELFREIEIDQIHTGFKYTDLTNDGDMDVVFGYGNDIRWFENQGDSIFTLNFITVNEHSKVAVVADMDTNGMTDLVVYNVNDAQYTVLYQQIPGTFLEGPWGIPPGALWSKTGADDFNGDGLPDLMILRADSAVWYENRGFSDAPLAHTALRYPLYNFPGFNLSRLDGNSMPDILFIDEYRRPLFSLGAVGQEFSSPAYLDPRVLSHVVVNMLDLTGDQVPDLVAAVDSTNLTEYSLVHHLVGLWNDGTGQFSMPAGISEILHVNSIYYPGFHNFGDLDGDGYADLAGMLVLADSVPDYANSVLFVAFNAGDGSFGSYTVIDSAEYTGRPVLVDLDNDSDLDIIMHAQEYVDSTQNYLYTTFWYRNNGPGTFSGRMAIDMDADLDPFGGYSLFPADLDDDGAMDLLAENGTSMLFLPGLGDGTFGDSIRLFRVNYGVDDPSIIALEDVRDYTMDGDPDILVSILYFVGPFGGYYAGKTLFVQDDSTGEWGSYWIGASNSLDYYLWGTAIVDLDVDGDPDIVTQDNTESTVVWYENDGTGNLGLGETLIWALPEFPRLLAGDVDGDDDPDLVLSHHSEWGSFWYENLTGDSLAFVNGRVYRDLNGNQTFDSHDEAYGGFRLTVEPSGQEFYTDSDGSFRVFTQDAGNNAIHLQDPISFDCSGPLELTLVEPSTLPFNFEFQAFIQIEQDFIYAAESNCRRIGGTVFSDVNSNGLHDPGEPGFPWARLNIDNGEQANFSWGNGIYFADVLREDTVLVSLDSIWVQSYCGIPIYSYEQTFPSDGMGYTVPPGTNNIDTLNFGIHYESQSIYDAGLYTLAVQNGNEAGETFHAWMDFKTQGNPGNPCILRITHSPLVSMLSSDIPPMTQTASYVEWVFPEGSAPDFFCMNMTWKVADEAVEGDTLHWEANYDCPPGMDDCPANNHISRIVVLQSGPVRMAAQPAVLYSMRPEGEMPEVIDRDAILSYVLYFQNPLPVPAYDVTILYDLPDALDPATVSRPFSSFPDYDFRLNADGQMIITMENIRLPDAESDPAGSYGFLQFNVRLKDDLPDGTVIPLEARVLFNSQREETSNEVIHRLGSATAVFDPVAENGAAVYPNPFREEAVFEWKQPVDFSYDIVLTDLPGRQVKAIRNQTGQQVVISSEGLSAGWYLLNVYSSAGRDLLGSFPVVVE